MDKRIKFINNRNYKTEVFYEEEKPFLKIEFDADIENKENGIEENFHCVIHKIGLTEFTIIRNDVSLIPSNGEIKFNIYPIESGTMAEYIKTN